MNRPPVGTMVVVALLAAGSLATAARSTSTPRPAGPSQVAVEGATAVCPDLRQVPKVLSSRLSVGVTSVVGPSSATPSTVSAHPIAVGGGDLAVPVEAPGQVATSLATQVDRDGVVIRAGGSLAAGLEVEQISRGESGPDRGLAGLRCEPPRTEAWFEGGNTGLGDSLVLTLANVDATPALVDVSTWTRTGPVDPRAGQGLVVPPHGRLLVPMDTLAPDRALLAVHVAARRGRVASALRYTRVVKNVPQGVEWVPQTAAPALQAFVPGIPQGPGQRFVLVTNPGTDDTSVRLQVTTGDGQFVPTGREAVPVPAGTTVYLPLLTLTDAGSVAARVTSDGAPVLAGALAADVQQGGQVADFAYAAAAEPLSGSALVTDVVIDRPVESTLILSAPGDAATVVVTPLRVVGAAAAPPAARTVAIGAGRTAVLKLSTFFPPGAHAQLAVEVRPAPGSGPVYAARYLRERGSHGPLSTLLILRGPADLVPRPAVAADPSVGVGGR